LVYFCIFFFQKEKNRKVMAEYIDSAVQQVLSGSRLKLAHPGNAKLTAVYPTPSDVTSVMAQTITHRGQLRVAPNSKRFGSRSDFILSSSALVSDIILSGRINIPVAAAAHFNAIGWVWDMMESIEITYSNSLMQNMFIRGETLKDWCLATCPGGIVERQEMLKAGGQNIVDPTGANAYYSNFSVPLCWLNHLPGGQRNSWPVDASVLAGPIQIAVNWRPATYFYALDGAGPVVPGNLPDSFDELELTCRTTQLQDASFSVKKAMMLDPQLVYSLPSRYITSVDYSRQGNNETPMTINLSSAPSGQLEAIIVSISPASYGPPVVAGTTNYIGASTLLSKLDLVFGGQHLILWKSVEEQQAFQRQTFGDNMDFFATQYTQAVEADNGNISDGSAMQTSRQPIHILPLVGDGCKVFHNHLNENVPSYGGSQIQLEMTPSRLLRSPYGYGGSGNPLGEFTTDAGVAAQQYKIIVGFIVSSIVEVSQGTVDLQL
jgi:hypothetical protein